MTGLTTYLQPLRRRMGQRLVIDRDPDHRKSIFIAGTGRSGGTWLADIINQRNDYRIVFEPFHPKRAPWMEPFGERKYLAKYCIRCKPATRVRRYSCKLTPMRAARDGGKSA